MRNLHRDAGQARLCQCQDLPYYFIDPRITKLARQLRYSCLESTDRCGLEGDALLPCRI